MSDRYVAQTLDDGSTITVITKDDDGHSWTSTRTYSSGSESDRAYAIEHATDDAMNKY